jgi:hypothetical protein
VGWVAQQSLAAPAHHQCCQKPNTALVPERRSWWLTTCASRVCCTLVACLVSPRLAVAYSTVRACACACACAAHLGFADERSQLLLPSPAVAALLLHAATGMLAAGC